MYIHVTHTHYIIVLTHAYTKCIHVDGQSYLQLHGQSWRRAAEEPGQNWHRCSTGHGELVENCSPVDLSFNPHPSSLSLCPLLPHHLSPSLPLPLTPPSSLSLSPSSPYSPIISLPLSLCPSAYILQLFIHNFVHGDLHPGNILVQETREPRIVLLDCGIATSLTPYDLQQMQKLFTAIIKGEVSTTCTYMYINPCIQCMCDSLCVELSVCGKYYSLTMPMWIERGQAPWDFDSGCMRLELFYFPMVQCIMYNIIMITWRLVSPVGVR